MGQRSIGMNVKIETIMKRYTDRIKVVLAAALALGAVSCQNECDTVKTADATRTVEVYAAQTRTTIGYEASDVSHLEWVAGDQVAYVTDVAGDTFKVGTMQSDSMGWHFRGEVSAEASTIYVIYPVGDNEGKTLAEVKATLASSIVQVAGEKFDGELLPMMATASLAGGSRVDAVYNAMASVLRLRVCGANHEVESLVSVTLAANESLAGDYSLSATTGDILFNGTSNTIKVDYTGAEADVLLAGSHDIYMVLPSAVFTGVNVVVETDVDTYTWSDGAMDLSHPERRLYRVELDLNNSQEAPAPQVKHFVPVCSDAELTDEGTYLLAVMLNGKYYVTNNRPTDTANYYYVEGVEMTTDDMGVVYSDDVMDYTWNITSHEGGYQIYSPNMLKNGTMGVLLISQGGTGSLSGDHGDGKAWYVLPSVAEGYDQTRLHWDIVLDGQGQATLYNKYDRGSGERTCYKYCTAHNYFTLCTESATSKAEITILKLEE